eukprot:SAG31_NODE_15089_length_771_cov_1.437500_1_plen_89_part_10
MMLIFHHIAACTVAVAELRTPNAPVATAHEAFGEQPPYVTLKWESVAGANGYWLQEWSQEQIIPGWYRNRSVGQHWLFQYNFGGVRLPS